MIDPIKLIFEAAYLHARRIVGMPLSQAETNRLGVLQAMLADEGRRRFLRLEVDCEALLTFASEQQTVRIVDLSAAGCLVEVSKDLLVGSKVRLTLDVATVRRVFTATVCRHAGGARFALRFGSIPLELRLSQSAPSLFEQLEASRA